MANPRTLFQFFISSTYVDLHEERKQVTWAILKTRNTPAGMEAFPAADDRGWGIIQRTIDDSDFYILLLGFRYGTVDPATKLSWTHKEYQYAKSKGIPILAFLRTLQSTPGDRVDDGQNRKKIDAFRAEVSDAHHKVPWSTTDELTTLVSQAAGIHILENDDQPVPRPGWVRGTNNTAKVAGEMAALLEENRKLHQQVAENDRQLAARDGKLERSPKVIYHDNGVSTSVHGVIRGTTIQNIGLYGIVLDSIKWLWQRAGGGDIVEVDSKARPQFIPIGAISNSLQITVDHNVTRVTIIVTVTSQPHEITVTKAHALHGELLVLPKPLPEPLPSA